MHVREFHWMCNFSIFLNEFDTDTIKPIPLRFTAIIFLPIPGSKFVKFGAPLLYYILSAVISALVSNSKGAAAPPSENTGRG